MTAAPAPSFSLAQSSSTPEQISAANRSCWSTERAKSPSRPTGVRMSTLFRTDSFRSSMTVLGEQLVGFPCIGWHAGQHTVELRQSGSQRDTLRTQVKFPNHPFMRAAALLDHRDCFVNSPPELEISQQDHRVGQVAEVHR